MKHLLAALLFLFCTVQWGQSQNYTSFFTGDTSDVQMNGQFGIVLAGGGSDNDDAMRWMLRRAHGGDVLVLRASGSSGYNSYFFSQLGVPVNSVETILFRNRQASFDSYVLRRINEAEIIFLAGGDQTDYYEYWKNTPVADILQQSIKNQTKVVGGTSAGMMILTDLVYIPESSGVISSEALANPYHPFMNNISYDGFVKSEILKHTFFETHFDQRNRSGRLVAFMARASKDEGIRARAIACNEVTAICIDEDYKAYIFGEHPQYPDFVYFLEANCESDGQPQTVTSQTPLNWTRPDGRAIIVQKMAGKQDGAPVFDLKQWKAISESTIEYWQVTNGTLEKTSGTSHLCSLVSSTDETSKTKSNQTVIYPNPTNGYLHFTHSSLVEVYNLQSAMILTTSNADRIDTSGFNPGMYILRLKNGQLQAEVRFVVY